MTDIALLSFAVDSGPVGKATADLRTFGDQAAKTGQRVEEAGRTYTRALSGIPSAYDRMAVSARGAMGNMRGAGGQIQNISYQLQDFAVQVQAGTSATQALGQQLPQLLGNIGPLGAALGVVAAVGIPLAAMFFRTGEGAKSAADAIEGLQSSVDAYSTAVDRANATPLELMEDYGVSIGQARALLEIESELDRVRAEVDLSARLSQVRALTGEWQAFSERGLRTSLADMFGLVEQMDRLREAAREAAAAGDDAEFFRLTDAMKDIEAQVESFRSLNDQATELAGTLGLRTASEAERLAVALASVDDSANPQQQARQWRDVREALIEAAGGVELLNAEGQELLDLTLQSEQATLRMAAGMAKMGELDIAAPFTEAWDAVDRLVGRIGDGLSTLQGWGGAVGDFVAGFADVGAIGNSLGGMTDGIEAAKALLRDREGFQPRGTWDVNAYRAGYGSDTVTLADGSIQAITAGMAVNRADAERDLERRTREFAATAMREIGADQWASLIPAQQAVLTSLAYNYGNLPDAVAAAVRSGSDLNVMGAIRGLGGDNGGVNRERRNMEAAIYGTGVGAETDAAFRVAEAEKAEAAAAKEAEERTRALDQARQDAERSAAEQARLTEAAAGAFQNLLASIDPAAAASQQFAEAQDTINAAVARGVISATEGAAAMEAFTRHQIENSEAALAVARAQEEAADEIKGIWQGLSDDMVSWMVDGFQGGLNSLKDMLQDTLRQLAMIALRNRIMIPIQTGIQAGMSGGALPGAGPGSGIMGGIGSALGGLGSAFMGGAGSVIGGLMSGGLAGAGTAITGALGGATASMAGFAAAAGAIALPLLAVAGVFMALRKKTELLDAGMRVTVNGMTALVSTFEKTKTSRFFGLIKNTSTDYDRAPAEIANPIRDAYRQIHGSVTDLGEVLGASSLRLKNFSHSFNLSLQGMTDEQKARAIEAEFAKMSDLMAVRMVPTIKQFAELGESATQTLTRLSTSLLGANEAMKSLGFSVYASSVQGAAAASEFVKVFGGLGEMAQATGFYFENFYSEAEQRQDAMRRLTEGFGDLGLGGAIPQTEAQFRALVDSLAAAGDMTKAGGLIKLAPIFQEITEAADALAVSLDANDFASRFEYERQSGLARNFIGTGLPLVTAPGAATVGSDAQAAAAIKTMDDKQTQLLLNSNDLLARVARLLNKFDKDGLPATRAA